ncbi:unnamed protein product [Caretta caretta]
MDRGSCFFYALEKKRGTEKQITCLLAEDSASLIDLEKMSGRARVFYTNLFSLDPTDTDACRVLWKEIPTISAGDQDQLELPLTLAEFSEALCLMPTNKSPSMDGDDRGVLPQLLGCPQPGPCHLSGLSPWGVGPSSVVQDPGNLVWVEACQATYSVASYDPVNWVKSSGLMVGDSWQVSSL